MSNSYICSASNGDRNRDTSFLTSDMAYFEYGKMWWARPDGQIETGGDFIVGNCRNITPEDASHVLYMGSEIEIPNASKPEGNVGLYCVSKINKQKDYVIFGKLKDVINYRLPYPNILWITYQGRKSRGHDTTYVVIVLNKFEFTKKQIVNILKCLGNVKPFIRIQK